ncbi:MAG: hypothetical protein COT81_00335 [Candidatus Buchananbacteria bacterium CG10_big_fil_rev_8_21_14_0_10_42_9]|uniref:PilN domain-containing protein n=1 Tax=Candidatus Buchananbacteria bacterium CG10_big_fil_rev_8_21_14_0_10_42_9 TaxID=1974526 RepID=A0A2H0W2N0_9BACT|nr:MAG: hypothetical protein COT81_00335 [Candidatus Buchananbacteria bacterium CG10_big_fil_rev_8_21_14_0_10_42_9]
MITLNLLSPNKKQELKILYYFVFIKNIIFAFLIFVIALSILVLLARAILENAYYGEIENNTLVSTHSNKFSQEIKTINAELTKIASIQKDYVPVSQFLIEIINSMPLSIRLEALQIDVENKEITLRGFAPTREDLKNLVSGLNDLGYFETVEEPFSANFQKNNIDFNLDIIIKIFPESQI